MEPAVEELQVVYRLLLLLELLTLVVEAVVEHLQIVPLQ